MKLVASQEIPTPHLCPLPVEGRGDKASERATVPEMSLPRDADDKTPGGARHVRRDRVFAEIERPAEGKPAITATMRPHELDGPEKFVFSFHNRSILKQVSRRVLDIGCPCE